MSVRSAIDKAITGVEGGLHQSYQYSGQAQSAEVEARQRAQDHLAQMRASIQQQRADNEANRIAVMQQAERNRHNEANRGFRIQEAQLKLQGGAN